MTKIGLIAKYYKIRWKYVAPPQQSMRPCVLVQEFLVWITCPRVFLPRNERHPDPAWLVLPVHSRHLAQSMMLLRKQTQSVWVYVGLCRTVYHIVFLREYSFSHEYSVFAVACAVTLLWPCVGCFRHIALWSSGHRQDPASQGRGHWVLIELPQVARLCTH